MDSFKGKPAQQGPKTGSTVTNASGIISLFEEDDLDLKVCALQLIAKNIDNLWSEFSHLINDM